MRHDAFLRAITAVLCATLATGCLSNSYMIPPAELERIRDLPPEARAKKLRVVQRFSTNTDPPPAPPLRIKAPPPPPGAGPGGVVAPPPPGYGYYPGYGQPTFNPFRPVIFVDAVGSPRSNGSASTIAPTVGPDGGVVSSGGGGLGKALSGTSVDDAKALAAILVIAGIGLGVALAVTEGARWDGYVAVHPDHPVHLMGPGGSYRLTSLSQLHLANPQPSEEAVIMRHEGIGLWELARAPLNRLGLTYGIDVGARSLPIGGGDLIGATMFDFTLGAFVTDSFGVVLGAALSFGDDNGADAFGFAPRVEAQLMPLSVGALHLGIFGGFSLEDVDIERLVGDEAVVHNLSSPVGELGVMVQVEITARLAMNLRWGIGRWLAAHDGPMPQRFAIGMSVY